MSACRKHRDAFRHARPLAAAWLLAACAVAASAASIDPSVIDNPRGVVLDRNSSNRWQALFEPNPRWVGRQIAYLESHQPDQILSLLTARLLYRGEPWTRRSTDLPNQQWKRANLEVRAAILRALRSHRDTILADYLCQYLAYEEDPGLIASALVDLYLIDPQSTPTWAIRLADPRLRTHLPGAEKRSVRQRCLSFLVQTHGIDSPEAQEALDWALLQETSTERNHGISVIPRGAAQDLLTATVLRLAGEFRQGILLDEEGQFGLVLAITRLSGNADRELVAALMDLAVHADRAVATSAATALATSLTWDAPVAINDLAARAQRDPDPVVRQSLLAFLMRLYPSAIAAAAGQDSPWAELAHHQERLEQWELDRAGK